MTNYSIGIIILAQTDYLVNGYFYKISIPTSRNESVDSFPLDQAADQPAAAITFIE
jgi:hypothetical protein